MKKSPGVSLRRVASLGLLLGFAVAAHAQITFTFTGTANNNSHGTTGYHVGDTATFSFTLGSSFANTASFTATYNDWSEESTSDSQLFSAFSGTGIAGSYVRPTATAADPTSEVLLYSGTLLVSAGADISSGFGYSLPSGGSLRIATAYASRSWAPTFPQTFTQPNDYFLNFLGTYSLNAADGENDLSVEDAAGNSIYFDLSSVTISTSAIPEPSTCAAIFGAVALLGAVGVRKHRKWKAATAPTTIE